MTADIKHVSGSKVEINLLALPGDANTMGTVFGGRLLLLMDNAAAIAARRHSNMLVVTVAVDQVRFLRPIYIGNVINILASVNRAFNTSMEIGVKVISEDTGNNTKIHVASAYFTVIAMNENGQKCKVAQIKPDTSEEERRWNEAGLRKSVKLKK